MQGLRKIKVLSFFAAVSTAISAVFLTAPNSAHAMLATPTGYIIGFDGKCLDAANAFGSAPTAAGFNVQMWQCGASGGEDQQFKLVADTAHPGESFLEYIAPNGPYCVRQNSANAFVDNTTTGCQDWTVIGNEYVIDDGSGYVLNVKAASTLNGARVILYPDTGQANEQFMQPF